MGSDSGKAGTASRIGLLGGSFDPIHMAHLYMAEVVKQECQLDEIWFVPAQIPPHKQDQQMTASEDRIEMIRLAIRHIPYFRLSLIEFEREGPSYTVDTIEVLLNKYPGYHFSFIIGEDMVADLPNWHRVDDLIELVALIGVARPGSGFDSDHEYAARVRRVDMLPLPISSTYIRERKRKGKSIRFLVPEAVYHYIEEKRLYESTKGKNE